MINRVVLVGRLTRDPDIRKTQSGLSVANFTLACDRRFSGDKGKDKETDFINCVAWRQSADFICSYAKKGAIVGVEGRLQIDSYDDKNGNKAYKTTVQCDNVKLISGYGNKSERQGNTVDANPLNDYMSGEPVLEISSDDLPF
ncbi:single-stranded DNA-binding protein [Holdemania filiformis]|uniref:Single-stranded DNA-binding protein n=1 Tax=Holdemania filiformis TaxID=61171 RepID=A0A412G4A9_9FIRM|nr:single-stranded DNA-binding protein [Holdemania filiformis]RGR75500.1 single-stranded DNA-binding protein [Holdemania filiformis]